MAIYENIGRNYGYEDAKKRAKEFYKTIGVIWCPTLKEHIVFNQKGLKHLIKKKGHMRPKQEQMRRFDLLRYAQKILQDPSVTFTHETIEINHSLADFWIFPATMCGIQMKVVVRRVGRGKKHFFSIYGKIQKSTQ